MRAKLSAIAPTAIAAPRYGEASASESASAAASQLRRRRRHRLITLAHLAGPSRGSIGKSGSRLLALSRDSYPNGSDFRLCCFYCCCRCCFGLFSGVGGHIYQAQWPHGLCRFSLSAFLSEMLVIKPQFVNFLGSCGGAHLATSLAALFARCHKIRDGCCCCWCCCCCYCFCCDYCRLATWAADRQLALVLHTHRSRKSHTRKWKEGKSWDYMQTIHCSSQTQRGHGAGREGRGTAEASAYSIQ